MSTLKVYKLHFTSPLHIGDKRGDEDISMRTIHSDTLYAAVMACLAKTGACVPVNGDMGFTLSSTFPYYQERKDCNPVYFLPMPMQSQLPILNDVANAKKIKKVKWVDVALYDKILSGYNLFDNTDAYMDLIVGDYLTENKSIKEKEFVKSSVVQRVVINDRTGQGEAKPYFVDKICFSNVSGLYFIAEGDTTLLDKGLALLAQEGLGTDRHVGMGFFEYDTDTISINIPNDATHLLSLSMFVPESREQLKHMLDSNRVAYDFTRRGGWITTYPHCGLRKNAIYEFLPSSVFNGVPNTNGNILCMGKIVDLTPEIGDLTPKHRIWRNGKSIMLPIKLN